LNILFIHEIDWTTKVVFDLHSLSELLASFGHNVFVVDFETWHNKRNLLDFGSLETEEHKVVGRAHSGISLTLIHPGSIHAPFLDRASAFLTHFITIEEAIKNKKIDIIVLYSVPTNGYQVIRLAKKYNIPVVFRSIDILHELVPSKFFSPFTFSLEKWVYKHVSKVLTLSPKLSDYVIRMGADREKVELLLFGVDLNKFNPYVPSEKLRRCLNIAKDDLVVLYIGTLFDFSGLDIYLEQFAKVIKELPKARLVIAGGGILFNKLNKLGTELGINENIVMTGFQPFAMMPQFINMADICVNPFIVNGATRDIIPGKIIQYLACKKPVVATPLPGMLSLLKGQRQGIIYSNADSFAENTSKFLKDKQSTLNIGMNGYQFVKNNHDEIKIARKLEEILLEQVC